MRSSSWVCTRSPGPTGPIGSDPVERSLSSVKQSIAKVRESPLAPSLSMGENEGQSSHAFMIDTLPQQKSLPHSEESERAVLGAVLLDPEILPTITGRLRPEDFYLERHQTLFGAMVQLQEERVTIDLRTLQAKLEQQGRFEGVG